MFAHFSKIKKHLRIMNNKHNSFHFFLFLYDHDEIIEILQMQIFQKDKSKIDNTLK